MRTLVTVSFVVEIDVDVDAERLDAASNALIGRYIESAPAGMLLAELGGHRGTTQRDTVAVSVRAVDSK